MSKIPVFDGLGNVIGEFIPAGGFGCIGFLLVGILSLFMYPACSIPLVGVAITAWAITRPASFWDEHQKTIKWGLLILILLAVLCILSRLAVVIAYAVFRSFGMLP
jgi:hypothetical protein